jgi:ornithine cyclodeaminase
MLVIDRRKLQTIVGMDQAIEAVAGAFAQVVAGQAIVPQRLHVGIPSAQALHLAMPAYLEQNAALNVKLLTLYPNNESLGLPMIQGIVVLFDGANGVPLALMDASYLTALRTGAASGVATRAMAREDSRVLSVIGAGAQAFAQVWAVCSVRQIERVWIVNRTLAKAEALAERLRAHGAPMPADIRCTTNPREALAESDVLCCATSAKTPVFDDADLKDGTHINGVGSYQTSMQEIPAATIVRARLVVDQREPAWAEAGDLVLPLQQGLITKEHVQAELGELVLGRVAGRTDAQQITVFKSVGNAVQDAAVAHLAYQIAREQGHGTEVEL